MSKKYNIHPAIQAVLRNMPCSAAIFALPLAVVGCYDVQIQIPEGALGECKNNLSAGK